jgi:Heterokaryon incompatibility protein (HET)
MDKLIWIDQVCIN